MRDWGIVCRIYAEPGRRWWNLRRRIQGTPRHEREGESLASSGWDFNCIHIYIYIHVKSSTGRLREREGDPLAYDLRNNNTFHYFRLQRRNFCVQW